MVWKYKLSSNHEEITMPIGATLLSVGFQDSELMLWALVDSSLIKEKIKFRILGTGHVIENNIINAQFIGTAIDMESGLVFHVWKI